MKIGVNARFLNHPYTGIGQYTRYLFSAMASHNPDVQFLMIAPARTDVKFPQNVHVVVLPEKFMGSSGMRKTYWEQFQVSHFFKKHGVDLIHFPYPANPWGKFYIPTVVTVHDTIPWDAAEYRTSFSTRIYQDRCKKALKNATRLLTVSESSRKDIERTCATAPDKISVIHNGVAPQFFVKMDAEHRTGILQKYGINGGRPFFFYAGGYDQRKNVRLLVDTYLEKIAPYFEADLVLAGGKSLQAKLYESFDYLTNKRNEEYVTNQKGKLVTTGFIDEEDLPALYQSCYGFVSASRREGFNLPVAEALVSGAPVVCSDIAVHHEIAGDAAAYCSIADGVELAAEMKKLLEDKNYHESRKNLKGPLDFSWEKAAQQTMQIYKQLL